ncbi:cuticular protein RR-1 motif 3 isoform X1 [Bombyx mori]|uniref:Putative cuticle protein n=1 Tax=Bombyx mori TaxID=7091 RepID=C0H6J4_BOMMO|nr:cuticular protein RR-1 motif 3 precursor [Bombyx mori]FAA00505.1 TPA: putative cuticle protein [Bombyx mori]
MRTYIFLALVAVAVADVSHVVRTGEADAQIVSQDADVFPDKYQYQYQTSNGISGQEQGALVNEGREDASIAVQGSSGYTAPDGTPIQITYIADANGYQPSGAHLPTTPAPVPIPDYIARAIEYIRTHPPKPEVGQRI